jgi:hypothetical protein
LNLGLVALYILGMPPLTPKDWIRSKPRRAVSLKRDGGDFVVSFLSNNIVALRDSSREALCRACEFLNWEIVSDTSHSAEDGPT